MYNEMLTSKVYDFNIDIIEKQKQYIRKLEIEVGDKINEISQPEISEIPKKKLFVGDSVYVRNYTDNDSDDKDPFKDLQKSVDAGIVKKISSEDILPITPIPTPTKTTSNKETDDFFYYIDKYLVETEKNKITSWHIFFILFFIYILARIFSVDLKLNVDI